MTSFRFAVNVTPKPGILDPQGRAVEGSLGHLGIEGVSAVRIGRRAELTVDAAGRGGRPGDRRAPRRASCCRTRSSRPTRSRRSPAASSAVGVGAGED